MSIILITQALENALDSIMPALETAWDNTSYTPTEGVPYQYAVIVSEPTNPTLGSDHYREEGFLQIDIMYPLEQGSLPSSTRTELIRDTFKRGSSFTQGTVTVHIDKTPSRTIIGPENDRYRTVIRAYFHANVCS